jgi:hypothetical protein
MNELDYFPAGIARAVFDFKWNDWDPYEQFGPTDAAVVTALQEVSLRARIVYAIACLEWTAACLQEKLDTAMAKDYIQAFWMGEIFFDSQNQTGYTVPPPMDTEEFEDNTAMLALSFSCSNVINTCYALYGLESIEEGTHTAAYSELNPLWVLPEEQAPVFKKWSTGFLSRLKALFPFNENDPFGTPISRAFMMKHEQLSLEENDREVATFMNEVSGSQNPYTQKV